MKNSLMNLKDKARQARALTLYSIYCAQSGHPGGSLSSIDILISLFSNIIQKTASDLHKRDRFILSKGHAAPALYAVAALTGYLPISVLQSLRKLGAKLQGHPHVGSTPWVETSTGSLGQGFSVALGMAMGLRHQGIKSRVFALLGDGEMQEGEVWEALMCAAHYKLSRLCAILDYNKLQSDDLNISIMNIEPIVDKIRTFGWNVLEINGHDFEAIEAAFENANNTTDMPTFILAHTLKGAGVDFMEKRPEWHGSVKLSDIDFNRALISLGIGDAEFKGYLNEKY
jgi:transketolase